MADKITGSPLGKYIKGRGKWVAFDSSYHWNSNISTDLSFVLLVSGTGVVLVSYKVLQVIFTNF